jgi:arylsulfatase
MPRMSVMSGPDFQRSHRITASVVIPEDGAHGVIIADGSRQNGFVLYIKDNHLVYENNHLGGVHEKIVSSAPLPTGAVELAYDYIQKSKYQGTGRLYVNGKAASAEQSLQFIAPYYMDYTGSFDIGQARGSPVSESFPPPFKFSGTLDKVRVELK